jgi:hypothetical protein
MPSRFSRLRPTAMMKMTLSTITTIVSTVMR